MFGLHFKFVVMLVVICCALFQVSKSEKLEFHSFEPPFEEVDHGGQRIVSRHWRSYGTTTVSSNFIRLTPDRQSKKGAMWSRKAIGVPAFSTVVKFRISGQGKNFFGDGLGFWIVQQGYYSEGTIHGFQEKFVGVGIIFDTFKNTESISTHRDVTILVNDGEKTWEMMTEDVQGCNINVRYHADRADFSVTDSSRAKIIMDDRSLSIFVDSRNTGDWMACANISTASLPADWVRKAHLGFTATTGQLADNHDVLSLMSYSDFRVMENDQAALSAKRAFESAPDMATPERISRLEDAMNLAMDKLDVADHHVEHEMASVFDHIENLKMKIEKRETASETRIENLEETVRKEVDVSMSGRLVKLENTLKNDFAQKLDKLTAELNRVRTDVETRASAVPPSVTASSSSDWKMPFFLLLVVMVVGVVGMYFFYLHLLKKWKLP